MTGPAQDELRLRAAFEQYSTRVLAYALRHDPDGAHDVVSEVFLVAWRRVAHLPAEPLPWLLVIARNVLHNRRRGATRRQRLAVQLVGVAAAAATSAAAEDTVVLRDTTLAALATLTSAEREAVLLIAWDGLSNVDAAAVSGCSPQTFAARLHRARRRLARELHEDTDPEPPDHRVARPLVRTSAKEIS